MVCHVIGIGMEIGYVCAHTGTFPSREIPLTTYPALHLTSSDLCAITLAAVMKLELVGQCGFVNVAFAYVRAG